MEYRIMQVQTKKEKNSIRYKIDVLNFIWQKGEVMSVKDFLKKKDIVISPKRYCIDALSQMAQAVFASLLIGLIFKTIGEQGQNLMGNIKSSPILLNWEALP